MENLGIFCDHLVYFTDIANILWPYGIFIPILIFCTKQNLATLILKSYVVNVHSLLWPSVLKVSGYQQIFLDGDKPVDRGRRRHRE
jgi:hypothetical protein